MCLVGATWTRTSPILFTEHVHVCVFPQLKRVTMTWHREGQWQETTMHATPSPITWILPLGLMSSFILRASSRLKLVCMIVHVETP